MDLADALNNDQRTTLVRFGPAEIIKLTVLPDEDMVLARLENDSNTKDCMDCFFLISASFQDPM